MGIRSSKNYSLRRIVEKQAFHYLSGQHEMSILCQKALPEHVQVRHIGRYDTYCLYRPALDVAQYDEYVNNKEPAQQMTTPSSSPPPHCIFLCFHGNAESVYGLWHDVIKYVAAPLPQCAFLAVEYPGYVCEELTPHSKYWESETPTEEDIKEHALAVYDRVHKKWPDVPIVCLGRSLGCGVSVWLSTVRNVRALLLLAPYLSIMRVGVGWSLPYADIFDNALIAHKCRAQNIVIVHSEDDNVIPIYHSEQLLQKFGHCPYRKLVRRKTDGHNAKYLRKTPFVQRLLYHLGLFSEDVGTASAEENDISN